MTEKQKAFLLLADSVAIELDSPGLDVVSYNLKLQLEHMRNLGLSAAKLNERTEEEGNDNLQPPPSTFRETFRFTRQW